MMVVGPTGNAAVPQMTNLSVAGGATNATAMSMANAAAMEAIGMIQVAKMFPRDEKECMKKLELACGRVKLAEMSTYAYSKGGTSIEGASVHLLKAIAKIFGNIKSGYRIVESNKMETKCEAFAWDLESNYYESVPFKVRHIRHTRGGDYPLTDDREIYELIANNAARRERKCLEAVISDDVVEQALEWCGATLSADVENFDVKKMLKAFLEYNVTKEDIEAFIQRDIEALKSAPGVVVRLRKIMTAFKDGVAKKEDFFKDDAKHSVEATAKEAKPAPKKPTMEDALKVKPDGEKSVDDVL